MKLILSVYRHGIFKVDCSQPPPPSQEKEKQERKSIRKKKKSPLSIPSFRPPPAMVSVQFFENVSLLLWTFSIWRMWWCPPSSRRRKTLTRWPRASLSTGRQLLSYEDLCELEVCYPVCRRSYLRVVSVIYLWVAGQVVIFCEWKFKG